MGRRIVPYLIEATLIPMALFYVFLITFELKWAIVVALVWTYAAMGRRILTGRSIPGLLVLATLGISVRTVIYVLSGNDLVYFLQPIMRTVATRWCVRPLRAHRPAARRPVRGRLLPAQP